MELKRLSNMPYAQAHVIHHTDGSLDLISYTTKVAHISHDGWLEIYGLYSMTTRKHLSAFVKEYAWPDFEFSTVKFLANQPARLNIHTGEIKE